MIKHLWAWPKPSSQAVHLWPKASYRRHLGNVKFLLVSFFYQQIIAWKELCITSAFGTLTLRGIRAIAWLLTSSSRGMTTRLRTVIIRFVLQATGKKSNLSLLSFMTQAWASRQTLRNWRTCSTHTLRSALFSLIGNWDSFSNNVFRDIFPRKHSTTTFAAGNTTISTDHKSPLTGSWREVTLVLKLAV